MDIEYQRNLKSSYMILRGEQLTEDYDRKVLEKQKCRAFLPMQILNRDGKVEYWFDVSGKQSLELYTSVHSLDEEFFQKFLVELSQTIEWIERYLLDESHLMLSPETIFLDVNTKMCSFCYCLSYEEALAEQFQKLMENMLKKIDHENRETVKLVYELYDVSLKEGYQFEELSEVLERHVKKREEEKSILREDYKEERQNVWIEETEREEIEPYGKKIRDVEVNVRTRKNSLQEEKEKLQEKILEWKSKLNIPINFQHLSAIFKEKSKKKSFESQIQIRRNKKPKEEMPLYFEPEEEKQGGSHPTVLLAKREEGVQGILFYEGNGEQQDIKITNLPFLIGSDGTKVHGVIQNEAVSRVHARITKEGDVYFLEDLNSTNGTFLDQEILNYKVKIGLHPNSKIRFANECYCFR